MDRKNKKVVSGYTVVSRVCDINADLYFAVGQNGVDRKLMTCSEYKNEIDFIGFASLTEEDMETHLSRLQHFFNKNAEDYLAIDAYDVKKETEPNLAIFVNILYEYAEPVEINKTVKSLTIENIAVLGLRLVDTIRKAIANNILLCEFNESNVMLLSDRDIKVCALDIKNTLLGQAPDEYYHEPIRFIKAISRLLHSVAIKAHLYDKVGYKSLSKSLELINDSTNLDFDFTIKMLERAKIHTQLEQNIDTRIKSANNNPHLASSLFELACSYEALYDFDSSNTSAINEAVRAYRKAKVNYDCDTTVQKDTKLFTFYANACLKLANVPTTGNSETLINEAADIYVELSKTNLNQINSNKEDVICCLDNAVNNCTNAEAFILLYELFTSTGQIDKANKIIRLAIKRFPNEPKLQPYKKKTNKTSRIVLAAIASIIMIALILLVFWSPPTTTNPTRIPYPEQGEQTGWLYIYYDDNEKIVEEIQYDLYDGNKERKAKHVSYSADGKKTGWVEIYYLGNNDKIDKEIYFEIYDGDKVRKTKQTVFSDDGNPISKINIHYKGNNSIIEAEIEFEIYDSNKERKIRQTFYYDDGRKSGWVEIHYIGNNDKIDEEVTYEIYDGNKHRKIKQTLYSDEGKAIGWTDFLYLGNSESIIEEITFEIIDEYEPQVKEHIYHFNNGSIRTVEYKEFDNGVFPFKDTTQDINGISIGWIEFSSYYNNGSVVEKVEKNADEQVYKRTKYDEHGSITEVWENIIENGKRIRAEKRDSNGSLSKSIIFDDNEYQVGSIHYHNGKKTRTEEYNSSNSIIKTEEYNENEDPIKTVKYNANGFIEEQIDTAYNGNGTIRSSTVVSYEIANGKERLKEKENRNGNNLPISLLVYDYLSKDNDTVRSTTFYSYLDGNQRTMTISNRNGTVEVYIRDSNGGWVPKPLERVINANNGANTGSSSNTGAGTIRHTHSWGYNNENHFCLSTVGTCDAATSIHNYTGNSTICSVCKYEKKIGTVIFKYVYYDIDGIPELPYNIKMDANGKVTFTIPATNPKATQEKSRLRQGFMRWDFMNEEGELVGSLDYITPMAWSESNKSIELGIANAYSDHVITMTWVVTGVV